MKIEEMSELELLKKHRECVNVIKNCRAAENQAQQVLAVVDARLAKLDKEQQNKLPEATEKKDAAPKSTRK
jgi:hypothetical protein